MHEYAVAHEIRRRTWVVLALISLLISLCYRSLSSSFPCLAISPLLESPSVITTLGVLVYLYDRVGWRWKIFGLRMCSITDYSGVWEGNIASCHNGGTSVKCTLIVRQTWSRICCELQTEKSHSVSHSASIDRNAGEKEVLTWHYINTPHCDCNKEMHMHHGVTVALIDEHDEMVCDYYNCCRERQTCGTIRLRRRTKVSSRGS